MYHQEDQELNKDKKEMFMTPDRLRMSAIIAILYQYLIFKYFPFMNKKKFVDFLTKYIGKKYMNISLILSVQVFFRIFLVYFFEKLYKYRSLDVFKSQPEKKWLFDENPEKYAKLRSESYRNYFFKLSPIIVSLLLIFNKHGKKVRLEKFPSPFEMFYQINASLLLTDLLFYLVHRYVFHHKKFYPLHKDHHAYINTTVHASMQMTLIDYLFEIILPGMIGPRLFDMHIFTHFLYLISGNIIGILSHAGYTFPFNPICFLFPFNELLGSTNSVHHELHHNTFNSNFSALSIFPDWILGTILYKKK